MRFVLFAAMTARVLASDPQAGARDAEQPAPSPSAPLTLTVLTYDYEKVPLQVRAEAERETSRIYREIGVEVRWQQVDAYPYVKARSASGRTCMVVLAIASHAMTPVTPRTEDVLGVTPRAVKGLGWITYVFYSRIDAIARRYHGRVASILGYVFAHEIGHLLLPVNAHSDSGLMQADWTPVQLEEASHGTLRFTPEQAELIRQRMAAAMASRSGANSLSSREAVDGPGYVSPPAHER